MVSLKKNDLHELEILKHVEADPLLTNRTVASKLGVSVKLAHETLKRMVAKGLLHVKKQHSRRWDYFLTPRGIAEKARLTVEFVEFSMEFYREARRHSAQVCRDLHEAGVSTVGFLGTGELAEIAYLGVNEWQLGLIEVFDEAEGPETFMGIPVQPLASIDDATAEAIIVCFYNRKFPKSHDFLPANVKLNDRMRWIF